MSNDEAIKKIEEYQPLIKKVSFMYGQNSAEADDMFHRILLELHGNRRLMEFVTVLYDQAHRARIFTLRLRDHPVRSTQEHREILEYLLAGNEKAVGKVFRQHRIRAARELLDVLKYYNLPQL